MRKKYIVTLLVSLVLGIGLTGLFAAQMKRKPIGDCADLNRPLPASVRKVECTAMTYGFPLRFVESKPAMSVNQLSGSDPSLSLLTVSSTTALSIPKLLGNILLWTAILAGIGIGIELKLAKKSPQETSGHDTDKDSQRD